MLDADRLGKGIERSRFEMVGIYEKVGGERDTQTPHTTTNMQTQTCTHALTYWHTHTLTLIRTYTRTEREPNVDRTKTNSLISHYFFDINSQSNVKHTEGYNLISSRIWKWRRSHLRGKSLGSRRTQALLSRFPLHH